MSKRKRAIILVACSVCVVVLAVRSFRRPPTDEDKYRTMLRRDAWSFRLASFKSKHKLPAPLGKAIGDFMTRSLTQNVAQAQELVASGYFVALPFTNESPDVRMLMRQLGTKIPWSYYTSGNIRFIRCRSNEAYRIRQVVGHPSPEDDPSSSLVKPERDLLF